MNPSSELPVSAQRVQDRLIALGFDNQVQEMPETTRSAADAAKACGCTVAQIAKSIVFRAAASDRAVLVITSGANRVDEAKVAAALGETLAKADADFVRARTGFAIGGVAPIGHVEPPVIFIDRDLTKFEDIWAAAGTPRAVFPLTPDELDRMTGGLVIEVA
ncbi:MAG TPA: YbaK/EbsC family protein [Alphaproteobacteria bacterium]|nr:YbaK/EbsC family protein [Alphaproteobacteria bacterium]